MPRWDFEDEDQENGFFGDQEQGPEQEQFITEEEYQELVAKANFMQEIQLELIEQDMNQRLLADAVAFSKSSWFWAFMSWKSRYKAIAHTYRFFQKLTDCKGNREK